MPQQPWSDIRGMGNRLRHQYDAVEVAIIWDVILADLPSLEAEIKAVLRGNRL